MRSKFALVSTFVAILAMLIQTTPIAEGRVPVSPSKLPSGVRPEATNRPSQLLSLPTPLFNQPP